VRVRPNSADTPPPELMSFPGWPEYTDAGCGSVILRRGMPGGMLGWPSVG
jgi:hypothetical protein